MAEGVHSDLHGLLYNVEIDEWNLRTSRSQFRTGGRGVPALGNTNKALNAVPFYEVHSATQTCFTYIIMYTEELLVDFESLLENLTKGFFLLLRLCDSATSKVMPSQSLNISNNHMSI